MWNADALSTSVDCSEQSCVLSEEILATELIPTQTGQMQLSPLSGLPKGTEIEICGEGFNDRTAKIRCRGRLYFIFLQDLENQSALASYAWA
jgi:hypothetical protein